MNQLLYLVRHCQVTGQEPNAPLTETGKQQAISLADRFSKGPISHYTIPPFASLMYPNFISHYHLPDRPPFLSLSDLEGGIDNQIFQDMLNRHKWDENYNRRFGLNYLKTRVSVENKLRELFIRRGGKPKRQYPIYFVLGESKWFKYLNVQHRVIQIPTSELPNKSVSVTFPDSYITMTNSKKPYYEKVYFISEIQDFLSEYGMPEDEVPKTYEKYWEGDFEKYYEVQVWDDEILRPYNFFI